MRFRTAFKTSDPDIDNLNLDRIISMAMNPQTGDGWDEEITRDISDLYRAFLFLCRTYPDETIVPTADVDQLWHLHILDTRSYHQDCKLIFGGYLHHNPTDSAGMTDSLSLSLKRTIELIEKHFPQLVGDTND